MRIRKFAIIVYKITFGNRRGDALPIPMFRLILAYESKFFRYITRLFHNNVIYNKDNFIHYHLL